jgi:hypothetical protein
MRLAGDTAALTIASDAFVAVAKGAHPMPSSAANPQFTTTRVAPSPPHPAHPAINPQPVIPFTLLTEPGGAEYSIRFFNSGTDQPVRVYLMAFVTQPSSPTWSNMSLTLPPNYQPPYVHTLPFMKNSLLGATNLWIGCWWDDGTYATTAAYFDAHPTGDGHHTQPIIIG